MSMYVDTYEFELKITRKGIKLDPSFYPYREEKKDPEILEELNFKSLSAVEVIRKVLDYLR